MPGAARGLAHAVGVIDPEVGWRLAQTPMMLADGGDCLADLGAVRDQDALFGAVASDSTASRVVDAIALTPGLLDVLADAHAGA